VNKRTKNVAIILTAVALVIFGFIYLPGSNSYLGVFFNSFSTPNWDEVPLRYLVKNSIPVTILDNMGDACKLSAMNLEKILEHKYFIRADELARELNYNQDDATVTLPCGKLYGEKSRLNIWYATEDSPQHSEKFEFFVTEWNSTSP